MAAFTALAIASIASTAWSAYQQHKAGKQEKKAGELQQEAANDQASLSDYNAEVTDLQAQDALARGAEAEQRFRTGIKGIIGSQRAQLAAGNVDVGFGSSLDVQADAAFLGELDALTIRTNAAREAWGYKVEGEDLRRQAEITRKTGVQLAAAGRQRQSQANAAAFGTILGGATSLVQMRYGFQNKTVGG
jgi:hypothetical protein